MTRFTVVEGDVVEVPSDVLLLKYAQGHYGAARSVAELLVQKGLCPVEATQPAIDQCSLVETRGQMAPSRVLFLGAPSLPDFGYPEMYAFAFRAAEALTSQVFSVDRVTTTVHGVGYGLDAGESLQNLIRGFSASLRASGRQAVREITFVEQNLRRATFLSTLLQEEDAGVTAASVEESLGSLRSSRPALPVELTTAAEPATRGGGKEHIFVAMPFSEEFEDVYELAIYPALRSAGYICERLDRSAFTGDIHERMKQRIRTAKVVLADLSQGRPNVYLEVGYAWGLGVPVLLLARKGEELHFDVATHRCLYYASIRQLRRELEEFAQSL